VPKELRPTKDAVGRGVRYLLKTQEQDGQMVGAMGRQLHIGHGSGVAGMRASGNAGSQQHGQGGTVDFSVRTPKEVGAKTCEVM